ncbi:MAG: SGNH/GDSL hydrolase family protein, partial [Streptosporangiaceae bacterium]
MSLRLVCVGDSFTEGMCDDLRPDGNHLGWADRVAQALACREAARGGQVEYANLAIRGKLLDQVTAEQVGLAVSVAPGIATFHAGPNDVLRPRADLADLCARYAAAGRMADGSGRLVLFTSIGRAGGDGRFAGRIADRFARFNDNVRS